MTFNADTSLSALEPPTITIDGRTYVGRFPSLPQYQQFVARWRGFDPEAADAADVLVRFTRDLCDTLFPSSRWTFWRPSMAARVLSLPPKLHAEAIAAFSASLASSLPSQGPQMMAATTNPNVPPNATPPSAADASPTA